MTEMALSFGFFVQRVKEGQKNISIIIEVGLAPRNSGWLAPARAGMARANASRWERTDQLAVPPCPPVTRSRQFTTAYWHQVLRFGDEPWIQASTSGDVMQVFGTSDVARAARLLALNGGVELGSALEAGMCECGSTHPTVFAQVGNELRFVCKDCEEQVHFRASKWCSVNSPIDFSDIHLDTKKVDLADGWASTVQITVLAKFANMDDAARACQMRPNVLRGIMYGKFPPSVGDAIKLERALGVVLIVKHSELRVDAKKAAAIPHYATLGEIAVYDNK